MTDGPQILLALKGVQQLHAEVALLLKTAEDYLVGEIGLGGLPTSRATGDGSTSLNDPQSWTPSFVARFYRTADERVLAFVSVCLVDRRGDRFAQQFVEPLVSAGWIQKADPIPDKWSEWWRGKMAHWTHHPHDGTMSDRLLTADEALAHGCVRERCLTLPLARITSSAELVERVLDPMVATLPGSTRGPRRADE